MENSQVKKQLESELETIKKQLAELGLKNTRTGEWQATPGAIDTSATEPNELADRIEDMEERQIEIDALEARQKDVLDALAKIEAGTWGICEVCGNSIEEARLAANPAARTCIAHAI